MYIGIDFGTSYSAAAAIVDGALTLIDFGGVKQFRTAVFFPEVVPDPADFELTPELEAQVEAQWRAARTQQRQLAATAQARGQRFSPRSDEALRRDAIRAVRRQWLEAYSRASASPVVSLQDALFGEEAVEAYMDSGGGNLVESPKSMFGYRMDPRVRKVVVNIATHILEHIRLTATRQLGVAVRGAVIGRPVVFRSSMGQKGGEQAIEILREAAVAAGFDDIAFLEEPAAAAMHYHKQLQAPQQALIVDIGGGTTDVTYAELGGARPQIHRNWGLPKGGTDLDIDLSLQSFMPLLGKHATEVPAHHFVAAASVQNLPKQREFRGYDYRRVAEPYGGRLRALQEPGATTRLNQRAEQAKITLSAAADHRADLGFLQRGLEVEVSAGELRTAMTPFLTRLAHTLGDVRETLQAPPDSVFITGGTSRSPLVRAAVSEAFEGIALVAGDPSLGVVSGLAVAASEH